MRNRGGGCERCSEAYNRAKITFLYRELILTQEKAPAKGKKKRPLSSLGNLANKLTLKSEADPTSPRGCARTGDDGSEDRDSRRSSFSAAQMKQLSARGSDRGAQDALLTPPSDPGTAGGARPRSHSVEPLPSTSSTLESSMSAKEEELRNRRGTTANDRRDGKSVKKKKKKATQAQSGSSSSSASSSSGGDRQSLRSSLPRLEGQPDSQVLALLERGESYVHLDILPSHRRSTSSASSSASSSTSSVVAFSTSSDKWEKHLSASESPLPSPSSASSSASTSLSNSHKSPRAKSPTQESPSAPSILSTEASPLSFPRSLPPKSERLPVDTLGRMLPDQQHLGTSPRQHGRKSPLLHSASVPHTSQPEKICLTAENSWSVDTKMDSDGLAASSSAMQLSNLPLVARFMRPSLIALQSCSEAVVERRVFVFCPGKGTPYQTIHMDTHTHTHTHTHTVSHTI